MDLFNDTDFSVTVDDFTFVIMSKHFLEDKKYILYKSINNKTKNEIQLSAYTSTSEFGCWRFCRYSQGRLSKFDNYIQSTILDFRIQDFIWKIFDRLPETSEPPTTPGRPKIPYCPNDIKGSINTLVNKRKILLSEPIDKNNYNIIDRYGTIIDDNVNKIKNSKIIFTKYKTTISHYTIENEIFGIRIKHKTTGLILIAQIGSFKMSYTLYNYDGQINEVKKKKGYYVLNLLPENYNITELGLYNKYYVETMDSFYDDDYNPQYYYVTKPLDYKHQVSVYEESAFNSETDIGDEDYLYIAHLNNEKFIIDELVKDDKHIEETTDKEYLQGLSGGNYKNKYLKYKKKYLELKRNV